MNPQILELAIKAGFRWYEDHLIDDWGQYVPDEKITKLIHLAQAEVLEEAASFTNLQQCRCDVALLRLAVQKRREAEA